MSHLDPEPAEQPRGIRVEEKTIVFASEPLPSVLLNDRALFDDDADNPTVAWDAERATDLREELRAAQAKARAEQRALRAARAEEPPTSARAPAWTAVRFLAVLCAVVGVGAALGFVAMDQAQHRVQLPDEATQSLAQSTPPLWSDRPLERGLHELGL